LYNYAGGFKSDSRGGDVILVVQREDRMSKKRIEVISRGMWLIVIIGVVCFFAACASGRMAFRRAESLQSEQNYIEAIEYYMKAVRLKPEEARYRLKLMEVLIEASNYFYRQALEHKNRKNFQLALLEINKALEYNPSNNLARLEKKALLKMLSSEAQKEEKTWLQIIKEKTSLERRLLAKADEEKVSLEFSKKADLEEIFKTLGKVADMNIIFDSGFKSSKMAISLKDISLTRALDRICLLKDLYYKLLDEKTIIIIPDTPAKHKSYDRQIIKNYYLSNIKADDCVKLINRLTQVKNIMADNFQNTITVRDIPEKVALVEKLIRLYDKRKAEVLVKVDIMEVNKDRLSEYGVEFSQYQISQSLVTESNDTAIRGNRFYYLDSSDFKYTIPTIIYKLMESDSDSRVIARPQVRGEDGEKILINLGDKVPYPRTSFVPFATGGLDQQPITSYDLQDVGIEITITPHVHHNGEISLELDFKLTFITSPGTTTLPPTIGNRSVKTRIRLKDGETGIMAGLLRDSERRSKKGFPGLNRIPILGNIFSSNRNQVEQTDIILRVTPYILRMPDISEEDLSAIESGTEDNVRLKK
jgi:general secretion pathway protein D